MYASTAKPQLREKWTVRRNVCVRHRVPSYLPFWNCTGKTEIKPERVWRPLDSRKAGSRTISSTEPTFASLHEQSTATNTLVVKQNARITFCRPCLSGWSWVLSDMSSGRSGYRQKHELGMAPTDTWLSVGVVLRQMVGTKRWYEGSSYSCASAGPISAFAFSGPVKLKTSCCPRPTPTLHLWGGGCVTYNFTFSRRSTFVSFPVYKTLRM